MKCERCTALRTMGYEYPETYCCKGIDNDHEKATEDGCTLHPMTVKKMVREYDEAWEMQYQDIGEWYEENEYNKKHNTNVSDIDGAYVKQAIHCIGLDYAKPYTRHGKKFYEPYRNHYDAGGKDIEIWDALTTIGHAYKNQMYHLTDEGFRWIGKILNITIKKRGAK